MTVIFRTDASIRLGTGHVMRCLTAANALAREGVKTGFISSGLPAKLEAELKKAGHEVHIMSGDFDSQRDIQECISILSGRGKLDWVVVDHYSLDASWERALRPFAQKVAVIDDLADRSHDCDLLLDQNYYPEPADRYRGLVPPHALTLLGPQYALLRPEFFVEREKLHARDGHISQILISFGGTDPSGETLRSLRAIFRDPVLNSLKIEAVVGVLNPGLKEIEKLVSGAQNVNLRRGIKNMAQLMAASDLCIGAGGSTTWERCFLGLPTITIQVAVNQTAATESLAEIGVVRDLGFFDRVTEEQIAQEIRFISQSPEALRLMSEKALQLTSPTSGDRLTFVEKILGSTPA